MVAEGHHWAALGTAVVAEGQHWAALGAAVVAEGHHWVALGAAVHSKKISILYAILFDLFI